MFIVEYGATKEEKFDNIYRLYSKDVYKVCLYYSKNEDLAQDLMQQTFLKFYDHFEKLNPNCMQAYLIRSAKNLFLNYQRDTKREILAEEISAEGNPVELASESLEEDYFQQRKESLESELSGRILKELRKENEDYYQILVMLYLQNKSHEEISEKLGLTKEVLYSRIYRAKKWVRKHYKDDFENLQKMV